MANRSKTTAPPNEEQPEPASSRDRKIWREEQGEEVVDLVLARARDGDPAAMRIVFDEHCRSAKLRNPKFVLRKIESADDAREATTDMFAALSEGKISADEAERILKLLNAAKKSLPPRSNTEDGGTSAGGRVQEKPKLIHAGMTGKEAADVYAQTLVDSPSPHQIGGKRE
jgi:hypothetical protein